MADDECEFLLHEGFLVQVADAEADTPDLVRVGRSDAAPGGAEAVVATRLLLELIEQRGIPHHHMGAFADYQLRRVDPAPAQLGNPSQNTPMSHPPPHAN